MTLGELLSQLAEQRTKMMRAVQPAADEVKNLLAAVLALVLLIGVLGIFLAPAAMFAGGMAEVAQHNKAVAEGKLMLQKVLQERTEKKLQGDEP